MAYPPVRGDNARALASGLSYVQVDKDGVTISYHLYQCRPCTCTIYCVLKLARVPYFLLFCGQRYIQGLFDGTIQDY